MSYRYQLGLTGLLHHLKFVSLLILCLVDISISVSGMLMAPPITVLLLISPYFKNNFCSTRSSLLLRTSLFSGNKGYSVIAVHWIFNPVLLLMQITSSRVLRLSSCGPLV